METASVSHAGDANFTHSKVPVYESSSERVLSGAGSSANGHYYFHGYLTYVHTYLCFITMRAPMLIDLKLVKYVKAWDAEGAYIRYRTGTHRQASIGFEDFKQSTSTNPILANRRQWLATSKTDRVRYILPHGLTTRVP
jgi:hypothetical protein